MVSGKGQQEGSRLAIWSGVGWCLVLFRTQYRSVLGNECPSILRARRPRSFPPSGCTCLLRARPSWPSRHPGEGQARPSAPASSRPAAGGRHRKTQQPRQELISSRAALAPAAGGAFPRGDSLDARAKTRNQNVPPKNANGPLPARNPPWPMATANEAYLWAPFPPLLQHTFSARPCGVFLSAGASKGRPPARQRKERSTDRPGQGALTHQVIFVRGKSDPASLCSRDDLSPSPAGTCLFFLRRFSYVVLARFCCSVCSR